MGVMMSVIVFAAPTVTDVVAKQRYPWNGLVDITCNVEGIDDSKGDWHFVLSAIFPNSENATKMSKFWVVRDGVKSSTLSVDANGNYRLLWDAKAELGEVRYTNMVVRVIVDRARVQLWEGGPYWATTNIGAEKPKDYGYYFWWGDTVGYNYKQKNNRWFWVASDGSNANFSFCESNTPTYNKGTSTLQNEGWTTADGVLAPEHDAAWTHWGGDWRMPTSQEFSDLNSKCDWVLTSTNGIWGYVVRGKGEYSSKSIFLPCAGLGAGTSLHDAGSDGYYWSSVPLLDYYDSWSLRFYSGVHGVDDFNRRYLGRSVRPLQGFTK